MDHQHLDFYNGQNFPILGLGTWQATERDELEKAMNTAFEAGYRHFDTAYAYNNEQIIGDVINSWLNTGRVTREELFITSKLPGIGMDESRVTYFMRRSLEALKLGYVDLYLIHMPIGIKYVDDTTMFPMDGNKLALDMTTDLEKVWKGMEGQVTAGRAKAIGISNFTAQQVERILATAEIKPVNMQAEANIYFQQKSLRETCAKYRITFCAYAPFGSPGCTAFYKKLGVSGFVDQQILSDPVVCAMAKGHGKTSAQILLRFLVQLNMAVIPKSTNPTRIIENSAIFDFDLTPVEMKQLEELDRGGVGRKFNFFISAGAEEHPEFPH